MRNVAISFEFRWDYFFEINLVILNKMQLITVLFFMVIQVKKRKHRTFSCYLLISHTLN